MAKTERKMEPVKPLTVVDFRPSRDQMSQTGQPSVILPEEYLVDPKDRTSIYGN